MSTILDTIIEFFHQDDWHFERAEDESYLRLGFKGEHGRWSCIAQALEEREQMVFYSVLPSVIPLERRGDVSEFITRANYGLLSGNFELDWNDGEVRYKTMVDVEGGALTLPMVRNLVHSNLFTVDRYFKGLMNVVYSDKSPALAVAESENPESVH